MLLIMDLSIVRMAAVSTKLISRVRNLSVPMDLFRSCVAEERGGNRIVPFVQHTHCCLNTQAVFEQQEWPLLAVREVF